MRTWYKLSTIFVISLNNHRRQSNSMRGRFLLHRNTNTFSSCENTVSCAPLQHTDLRLRERYYCTKFHSVVAIFDQLSIAFIFIPSVTFSISVSSLHRIIQMLRSSQSSPAQPPQQPVAALKLVSIPPPPPPCPNTGDNHVVARFLAAFRFSRGERSLISVRYT